MTEPEKEPYSFTPDYDLKELEASTRENLEKLQGKLKKLLGQGGDHLLALDYPDMAKTLVHWLISINKGIVPDELGDMTLPKAQLRVKGIIEYLMLVTRMLSELQFVDLAVQSFELPDPLEDLRAAQAMRKLGYEEMAEIYDKKARLGFEVTTGQARDVFPFILAGLRTAVQLLASTDPEDVIRGRQSLEQSRSAAKAPKFSRALQATINEAYEPGMTEEQCWKALEPFDDYEFEVDGSGYRFVAESERQIYVVDLTTKKERLLRRSSFDRYFRRAKGS